MKVLQFLIDASGTLIYPSALPSSNINGQVSVPSDNQINIIFYNAIQTVNGVITPITPVTSGLTGTVTLQARTTVDSAWSNIKNGELDISTDNMAFPSGAILQVQALCSGVTGCNYILVQMYRGA